MINRAVDLVPLALLWFVAPAGGCNPRAAATVGGSWGESERNEAPFVEGETCTRSADCPRETRCLDGRCQPTARSYQGEVLAERGTRALALGEYAQASEAYRAAERAYQDRHARVPAAVSCGLARALTAQTDRGASGADAREATARALATCLAAAPPGSVMAEQALAGLAGLSERGLDVGALDRQGGTLMTGRDPRPTADNTRVRVTFTGQGDGSRAAFRQLVESEPTRREITRCFLQWWETSRQSADQGTVRVTFARAEDDYGDLGAPRLTVSPADIAAPADAGQHPHWLQCSANAINAAASGIRWPARADRWAESVVISVGPGG